MRHVYQALKEVLRDYPEAEAIFPMHKNPKVREVAEQVLGKMDRVHLIEPMDYEPFANLMARVDIVLTDSGGNPGRSSRLLVNRSLSCGIRRNVLKQLRQGR